MKKKTKSLERDKDRDMIRQRWPKMSLEEKIKYIFSYYGIAIFIVLFAVLASVFLIRDIHKKKVDDAFYVMVIDQNLPGDAVETMERELSEVLGLEPGIQQCRIEAGYSSGANMQSEATISTYMRSGRVDLVIAPEEVFNRYASTGYLSAFRDCGLQELEEQYTIEDLFYAEAVDYSEAGAVTELPFHPHERTEASDCYGICLRDGVFQDQVAGVMVNCPNRERIRTGIRYFLEL